MSLSWWALLSCGSFPCPRPHAAQDQLDMTLPLTFPSTGGPFPSYRQFRQQARFIAQSLVGFATEAAVLLSMNALHVVVIGLAVVPRRFLGG